jgi:hypothetical protein
MKIIVYRKTGKAQATIGEFETSMRGFLHNKREKQRKLVSLLEA